MSQREAAFSKSRCEIFIRDRGDFINQLEKSLADLRVLQGSILKSSSASSDSNYDWDIPRERWGNPLFIDDLCRKHGTKGATAARTIADEVHASNYTAKIVVFSAYSNTLTSLHHLLNRCTPPIQAALFVSGTDRQRLSEALASFRTTDRVGVHDFSSLNVLLLQLTDESAGANLLLASHILLIDTVVGPAQLMAANERQAVGRALRQLMDHTPTVIRIVEA